jgi:hypothetical protein
MALFKLFPRCLEDSRWRASTRHSTVTIRAPDEETARYVAALAYLPRISGNKTTSNWDNPWGEPRLTLVEAIEDQRWPSAGPVEILDPPDYREEVTDLFPSPRVMAQF